MSERNTDDYTNMLEDAIWKIADEWDSTEDDSVAVNFLNAPDSFLSFGEGILRIINTVDPSVTISGAAQYIRESCKKNDVPTADIASAGTLSNWFSKEMRPKKGEASRKSMFALAFALGLNIDETRELFHKVYLDRAFDYRNEQEVVFYYCLRNNRSWKDAEAIIRSIHFDGNTEGDHTVYTKAIHEAVMTAQSDSELIKYIQDHKHNFEKNSVTARETYSRLLSDAKSVAQEEISLPQNANAFTRKWKNGETISNNLLYEVITEVSASGKTGTTTIFRNANLPKEIKNRFPEAATLGKTDMTFEEQRKIIILLFSYCVWFRVQWRNIEYDIDDYKSEMDNLLFDANYPTLYYGNPYDWMFLYCAQAERPLDMFRNVVQEVLKESDSV